MKYEVEIEKINYRWEITIKGYDRKIVSRFLDEAMEDLENMIRLIEFGIIKKRVDLT